MSASRFPAPSADYLKTYSLSRAPFADGPDGRFFYGGSTLMQRLDLLIHLAQFGDSVVLVAGPPGSGKTTLLSRFVAQANRHWRLCLIHAQEFEHFGRRLADALGIGDTEDEQEIVARWASQSDASQLLVIVIDDAQQLQQDAIDKLCGLLGSSLAERVRLILFGTPQAQQAIKQSLEQKQLPCSAQLLEIPKLSEEETAAYLMYRLAVAGYSGESPFTATEVRAICKAADGRPADINRLAHEALQERQIRSRSKPLKTIAPRPGRALTWWSIASALVLLVAVYLGWEQPGPSESRDSGESVPLALPKPEPPTEKPPEVETMAPTADTAGPTAREQALAPEPAPEPNPETPAQARSTAPAAAAPTTPPTVPGAGKTPEPGAPAVPAAPAAAQPVPPAAAAAPANMQGGPTGAPAAPEPVASTTPAGPEQTGAPPAKADKPATPGEPGPYGEAWLLKQPGNRYTLQLLGSRHKQPILDYIRRNKLDRERCAYYQGSFKGGEWYVLVYGVFSSRTAALAARNELPARVQKEKPWARTLASIQTAIREQR
jgi:DamX protein